jgi:hypothetical protein
MESNVRKYSHEDWTNETGQIIMMVDNLGWGVPARCESLEKQKIELRIYVQYVKKGGFFERLSDEAIF